MHKGWPLTFSAIVLAAFAGSVAGAAAGRRWPRVIGAVATVLYFYLYDPFQRLAFNGDLPIVLVVWMPNIIFTTAALLLAGLTRTTKDSLLWR